MEQVDDGALSSVPQSLPHGVDVEGHGHLNETKGEHGRDDALGTLESPSAVVKSVVGSVEARVVVLVTREENLWSRELKGRLNRPVTISTYSRLSLTEEAGGLSTSKNGKVIITIEVSTSTIR